MLKVIEGGTPPKIKTKYSSSADLCSRVNIVIGAGETVFIPLGVKIDLEELKKIVEDDYELFNTFHKTPAENSTRGVFENFQRNHF